MIQQTIFAVTKSLSETCYYRNREYFLWHNDLFSNVTLRHSDQTGKNLITVHKDGCLFLFYYVKYNTPYSRLRL